jgi:hypothetical protein
VLNGILIAYRLDEWNAIGVLVAAVIVLLWPIFKATKYHYLEGRCHAALIKVLIIIIIYIYPLNFLAFL